MRNVEEANHILYGCIVIGSNPILTAINRKPLRVRIVKRREGSYCRKYIMNILIAYNVSGLCVVALSKNLKLTTTPDRAITQNPCYV